ncbi:fructose-1,6-bisphosphatase, chloroplastic [Dorcoceras hygrometricum]|uniref:fructose-bisphosphatase n=1 Tax=Dorcoceras hygrometricum TaxID=472368 RepID=A0A2Z7ABX4_9LAMI|nr:fructose-1,6-bisphosphatase, chloroplastic [Dorcoceras hygrometricum]
MRTSRYEIENLTTWLLKQEQDGHMDTELAIVLASISLACKKIASLLQRSNIINLTGAQGTMNIQGEDQKKLDVIANEVHCLQFFVYLHFQSVRTPQTVKLTQRLGGNGLDCCLYVCSVIINIKKVCSYRVSLLLSSTIVKVLLYQNIQGEDQKKLDVIANELFCNSLRASGRTGIIASEEEDVPVAVEETYSGNYIVVFDPVDGSANIDTSLTTGSIFGIYAPDKHCLFDIDDHSTLAQEQEKCVVSACQPGSNLLAAGYCLYSSSVVFTLSIGRGVLAFTLDPAYGEFVLTHENIRIPSTGKIYSFNEGNYDLFDEKLQKYLDDLRKPGSNGRPYSGRYIGCLVGEIHRMLLVGGIYGNPKNKKSKNGNLRLLYECAPMSYLVEQAGGKATDGSQRILDIRPDQVHQRTPIFIGSADEVEKLEKYLY